MPFVLLSGFADQEIRVPAVVQAVSEPGLPKRRRRWWLPADPWFVERTAAATWAPPLNQVCILARLGPGQQCVGLLTPWNIEERLIWQHLGRPLHSFSWSIIGSAIHLAQQFLTIGNRRRKGVPSVKAFQSHPIELNDDTLLGWKAVAGWQPDKPGALLTTAHILNELGVSTVDPEWLYFKENLPMLFIPAPILALIGQGAWRSILQCVGWDRQWAKLSHKSEQPEPEHMWPEDAWLRRLKVNGLLKSSLSEPKLAFEPRHASNLCARLREWAPGLLRGAAGDQERGILSMELEDAVERLEHFTTVFSRKARRGRHWWHSEHLRADHIVKTYMAANMLKDRSQLSLAPMAVSCLQSFHS